MDAGKKMDALVAEKFLEWEREGEGWKSERGTVPLPPFSTSISDAFSLVDRITDRGFQLQLSGSRIWKARFLKSVSHTLETQALSATGSTPAEAICIAALLFKGVAVPK